MVILGFATFAFIKRKDRQDKILASMNGGEKVFGEELSIGATGEKVAEMQRWLISQDQEAARLINTSGGVDGIFGGNTLSALQIVTGKSTYKG